jgi:hypothetical protein
VSRGRVKQVPREYEGLRVRGVDPGAVKAAVLLEDVFGPAPSDDVLDLAVLAGPSAVEKLAHCGGSV